MGQKHAIVILSFFVIMLVCITAYMLGVKSSLDKIVSSNNTINSTQNNANTEVNVHTENTNNLSNPDTTEDLPNKIIDNTKLTHNQSIQSTGPSNTPITSDNGNPYYRDMVEDFAEVSDAGVKLDGYFHVGDRIATREEVLTTMGSDQLYSLNGEKIDMNTIIVEQDGTVLSRDTGEKVNVTLDEPDDAISTISKPATTSTSQLVDINTDIPVRNLIDKSSYRGIVDYNFHIKLANGDPLWIDTLKFVDSQIGMLGIPRYSFDNNRQESLLACNVVENNNQLIWVDFTCISIHNLDGSDILPNSDKYLVSIASALYESCSYNDINKKQLQQVLSDKMIDSCTAQYISYDEIANSDTKEIGDPSSYGPKPYKDEGVVEVSVGNKDFDDYYTVNAKLRGIENWNDILKVKLDTNSKLVSDIELITSDEP